MSTYKLALMVGQTRGRKAQGDQPAKSPKDVYLYPLRENWQQVLCDGPAAGGGSDRLNTRVPGTDQQLDRPPQQFLRDLNGRTGTGPHPKRIGSQEAPGR